MHCLRSQNTNNTLILGAIVGIAGAAIHWPMRHRNQPRVFGLVLGLVRLAQVLLQPMVLVADLRKAIVGEIIKLRAETNHMGATNVERIEKIVDVTRGLVHHRETIHVLRKVAIIFVVAHHRLVWNLRGNGLDLIVAITICNTFNIATILTCRMKRSPMIPF